jgi:hypothetical protein
MEINTELLFTIRGIPDGDTLIGELIVIRPLIDWDDVLAPLVPHLASIQVCMMENSLIHRATELGIPIKLFSGQIYAYTPSLPLPDPPTITLADDYVLYELDVEAYNPLFGWGREYNFAHLLRCTAKYKRIGTFVLPHPVPRPGVYAMDDVESHGGTFAASFTPDFSGEYDVFSEISYATGWQLAQISMPLLFLHYSVGEPDLSGYELLPYSGAGLLQYWADSHSNYHGANCQSDEVYGDLISFSSFYVGGDHYKIFTLNSPGKDAFKRRLDDDEVTDDDRPRKVRIPEIFVHIGWEQPGGSGRLAGVSPKSSMQYNGESIYFDSQEISVREDWIWI